MANIMAIVSKAVFEKMLGKEKPKLGQLLKTKEYVSTNPRLDGLKAGGTLFLVTVRPPKDDLWVVAVLEKPKHNGKAWVAADNAVTMTDINALKSKLKFDSGAGIQAKPGALGMSLQTPRVLTDADVALLRAATGAAGSAPAADAPASGSAGARAGSAAKTVVDPIRWRSARSQREALEQRWWDSLNPTEQRRHINAIEQQSKGAVRYARTFVFGAGGIPVFVHQATGLFMHLVPGATLSLGFSAADRELAAEGADSAALTLANDPLSTESRPVTVSACLLAARTLTSEELFGLLTGEESAQKRSRVRLQNISEYRDKLNAGTAGKSTTQRLAVIEAALQSVGLRLPSEAEWERAARATDGRSLVGGRTIRSAESRELTPYGLAKLGVDPEVCADGWRASHEGRPVLGTAVTTTGQLARVCKGGESRGGSKWQLVAARRSSTDAGDSFAVRPALTVIL